MTGSRYEGPFVKVIGEEDLLQPTPRRIGWLIFGLVGAVLVGFAIGLAAPRRNAAQLDR
ncbi:MAG TPA: hypothetical protein GXZ30_07630 [Propionibacterium sp.]|jgi:hypothetical protein|nr:hypothetical protein [Propionibacterium sp.]